MGAARRLAAGISVPAIPHTQPGRFPSEATRWQLLSRCLDDTAMPLDVRAAGALLLLYGQFVTRIVGLTTADLGHDGHDTYLQAGAAPALLPPKVAAVICAQRDATPARITYRHPSRDARPLFPGRRHGQHLGAEALTRKLRQHGIEPRRPATRRSSPGPPSYPPLSWPTSSTCTSPPPSCGHSAPGETGPATSLSAPPNQPHSRQTPEKDAINARNTARLE